MDTTNGTDVRFNISQFLVGWEYKPEIIKRDIKVFAALLNNHGATKTNVVCHGSKEKMAGYVGLQLGSVKKTK